MQVVLNIVTFLNYYKQTTSQLTQLLRGENAGILWHRSRMTRIMMTHDCKPFAFACGKQYFKQSQQLWKEYITAQETKCIFATFTYMYPCSCKTEQSETTTVLSTKLQGILNPFINPIVK